MTDTAEAFWEGRRTLPATDPLARRGGRLVFSPRPELPARLSYPAGAAVELSTQLQAWMVLEAAARSPSRLPRRTAAAGPTAAPATAPAAIRSCNSFVIDVILIT